MSEVTEHWYDGLSATARKAVARKFEEANRHVQAGEQSRMRAARELRIVHQTYFRGDKARFTMAASELFTLGGSAAYEYVQAADAERAFAADIKAAGTDPAALGVRTLAKLDRFTVSDDKLTEGRKVIAVEGKRKPGPDDPGRFTNAGLAATIRAMRPEGERTGTDDDRRIARIEGKYRDELRTAYADTEAVRVEKGNRAAFLAAVKVGLSWGAASGPLAVQAIDRLYVQWQSDDLAAAIAERKIKSDAERKAQVQVAAASLKPDPRPKPKPAAKVTESAAKPKRSSRTFGKATTADKVRK